MSVQAFVSRRVVTPQEILPAAVLVEGERIRAIVPSAQIPSGAEIHDFGDAAILPGLVDSHVHVNDPGRTEWEGFRTATRAAAAGGYTLLVDMPLNCLPATTTVAALEAKRVAAQNNCWVDWAAWGGVVQDNQAEIEKLAGAGVLGFKCFLIHPGIEGFTMVGQDELRAALPHLARTGLPLLVHAELAGPIHAATRLEMLRDLSAVSARRSGAVGDSNDVVAVPAISFPSAHCPSVERPGVAGVAGRPLGRAGVERGNLSSLSSSRGRRYS